MILDFMKHPEVVKLDEHYFVVVANTNHYGRGEIMFEGINPEECYAYIKNNAIKRYPDKYNADTIWAVKYNYLNRFYSIRKEVDGVPVSKYTRMKKEDIELLLSGS